ncbi:hypothetical protein CC78DRAFT_536949 [Lojkania enalia]|uniref:Uncharacterized protein n=1 Tax=Lojkania enalia TaxID=147567 RepID=A0A9P4K2F7_9PLEO|nr:hypothetical protein CC78DRAFT_536949 [Didymosphaeria enalia]
MNKSSIIFSKHNLCLGPTLPTGYSSSSCDQILCSDRQDLWDVKPETYLFDEEKAASAKGHNWDNEETGWMLNCALLELARAIIDDEYGRHLNAKPRAVFFWCVVGPNRTD